MKVKGENFYRDKTKLKRLNMLKEGRPTRNKKGDIVQAGKFSNDKCAPVARIQPDRRWFGNPFTIGQKEIEEFREEIGKRANDPYEFLMRRNKLPMSLLTDTTKISRMNLLETESFEDTFGKNVKRKKPKLQADSLEELVRQAEERFDQHVPKEESTERFAEKEAAYRKGQSKRIWGELHKVIDSSDVIIHVLDARDPIGTKCQNVREFIKKEASHKHLIYLLNKCDLVPTTVTSMWIKHLSKEAPCLAFHANVKNPFGKGSLIQLLLQFSKLHSDKKQISVGLVGYPNTGKSSVINTLTNKKSCNVAPIPGETKIWQYVTLMKRLYLIDCPGVVPLNDDSESETVLKGVVRVENIKTPEDHIDAVLQRVKPEHLAKTYNLKDWENAEDFLEKLAIKSGRLLKGGEADLRTVAKMVLNDWIRGKIPFHTLPPTDLEHTDANTDSGK